MEVKQIRRIQNENLRKENQALKLENKKLVQNHKEQLIYLRGRIDQIAKDYKSSPYSMLLFELSNEIGLTISEFI